MTDFTPLASSVGGLLIGLSAAMMLILKGRIAGISGIIGGLASAPAQERPWRFAFMAGLLAGGMLMVAWMPEQFGSESTASTGTLVVAGLLVGIGTRIGGGCTSGHGVCGLSRFSPRSMVATALFMSFAVITVFLVRHAL
ncbi:MAG: YeeE/YedE family protein [Nannocystaceae bacterium]|nr:YeeE/YedE family protein [Nannocystaceae bacterium]